MRAPVVGTALALLCYLSTPAVLLAKGGSSGGHSSGGHSGGGHSGGGHSGGGHSGGGHAGGGHATGGHDRDVTSAITSTASPSGSIPPSIGRAHQRDGVTVVRAAAPRTSPFLATPSTYAPYFVSPLFGVAGAVYGGYPGCASPEDCAPLSAAVDQSTTSSQEPLEIVSSGDTGDVRLDVRPASARVFVDGAFVGTVEDYLHSLAGLNLHAGRHHLEFLMPGYQTLVADIEVDAGRIITYKAELRPQPR
jgi:hypothetical protein